MKLGIDSSNDHNVVEDTSNDGFWGTIYLPARMVETHKTTNYWLS